MSAPIYVSRRNHGKFGYRQGCRCAKCKLSKAWRNQQRYGPTPPPEPLGEGYWLPEIVAPKRKKGPSWRCPCDPYQVRQGTHCTSCQAEAPWR